MGCSDGGLCLCLCVIYDYELVLSMCSMTGVGGRPELVIEGSNDLKHGWKVTCFHLYTCPSVCAYECATQPRTQEPGCLMQVLYRTVS